LSYPKITIVTPNYNLGQYIEHTINSVLSQNYPNLEYIIIDGGSTDNSVEIIKKYEKHLTWWVSESDIGMYDAVNKGFNRATGDIMAWINSDDVFYDHAFATVSKLFSTLKDVEWLTGAGTVINEHGYIIKVRSCRRWSKYHYCMGDYKFIQQESTFWRRSLWDRSGGYIDANYKFAGDLELWSRFFQYASLYIYKGPLGKFRKRQVGNKANENMEAYYEEANKALSLLNDRLLETERKVFRKIKFRFSLFHLIRIMRVFNYNAFRETFIEQLLKYPGEIHFDRKKQEFYIKE
jgi:glycosyltransferase involved in cell wall biosynthesis